MEEGTRFCGLFCGRGNQCNRRRSSLIVGQSVKENFKKDPRSQDLGTLKLTVLWLLKLFGSDAVATYFLRVIFDSRFLLHELSHIENIKFRRVCNLSVEESFPLLRKKHISMVACQTNILAHTQNMKLI